MEQNSTEPEKLKITRFCALDGCENEFTPTDVKHIFCSASCRAKNNRMKKKAGLGNVTDADTSSQQRSNPAPTQPSTASPMFKQPRERKEIAIESEGISPIAKFIIEQLKADRDAYKEDFKEERQERAKLFSEKEALQRDLDALRHQRELDEIRHEKPSALQGLTSGPMAEFIGPAISEGLTGLMKIITNKMGGGVAPAMPGLNGMSAEIMSVLAGWLSKTNDETQTAFYQMMVPVINSTEADAKMFFDQVINWVQQQNASRNGTYGM